MAVIPCNSAEYMEVVEREVALGFPSYRLKSFSVAADPENLDKLDD